MTMRFEELDDTTRQYMLVEFESEESTGRPYRGVLLSAAGLKAFPALMREAIRTGNEETLIVSLSTPSYWLTRDAGGKTVNMRQAAERLGLTEFNTWYVSGLAKRLISEGVTHCQVYRAAEPKWAPDPDCSRHEDQVYPVETVYYGHRARYWPRPGQRTAFSIPSGPSCHHTIRRAKQ